VVELLSLANAGEEDEVLEAHADVVAMANPQRNPRNSIGWISSMRRSLVNCILSTTITKPITIESMPPSGLKRRTDRYEP
jgi:hypothetical protein